jgi:hypothetical protein
MKCLFKNRRKVPPGIFSASSLVQWIGLAQINTRANLDMVLLAMVSTLRIGEVKIFEGRTFQFQFRFFQVAHNRTASASPPAMYSYTCLVDGTLRLLIFFCLSFINKIGRV